MPPTKRKSFLDEKITGADLLWPTALETLRMLIESGTVNVTAVAADLEMSHSALGRIISGETENPHARTRRAIIEWVQTHARERGAANGEEVAEIEDENDGLNDPEADLLEYFLEHHEQMATFLSTTTDGLSAADRRLVSLAVLNGFKKLAIAAGEPIPQVLYEIEKRFVAE